MRVTERDREMCSKASRDSSMSSHGRTESRTEPTKILFEEVLKIVKSEAEFGRTFPTQELDFEFSSAPGLGWKTQMRTKHAETVLVVDTEDCNSSQHWRRRVRKSGKHYSGRDESQHPAEQM